MQSAMEHCTTLKLQNSSRMISSISSNSYDIAIKYNIINAQKILTCLLPNDYNLMWDKFLRRHSYPPFGFTPPLPVTPSRFLHNLFYLCSDFCKVTLDRAGHVSKCYFPLFLLTYNLQGNIYVSLFYCM